MKRIIIIGCPGSGKSTFARELHKRTNLPLYYLDMLYWNADRTTVAKEEFRRRLGEVLEKDRWIIDGNYNSTMEMRMAVCDTVIVLDYPTEVCLAGIHARRGKVRPDMPWVETGEDAEFEAFVRQFREESRPKILSLLEQYREKEIHVFHDRAEADAFLAQITE
jgi:adenylate kinase family enzyme